MTTNSKNILNKIKECTEGSEVKVTFEYNDERRIEEGVVTSISKTQKQITIENDTDEWIFDFKDIIDIEIENNLPQQRAEKTPVNNNKQISKIKDIILIVIVSFLIATTVCLYQTFGGNTTFNTQSSPSKQQTCEDVIAYHIQDQLDLCRQVEYERSRYRRAPQSLEREKRGYYLRVNLYLETNFGEECSNKWHKAVYIDNDCPF